MPKIAEQDVHKIIALYESGKNMPTIANLFGASQSTIYECLRKRTTMRSKKKPNLTTELFIAKSIEKHGSKYTYEESVYVSARAKIKITCPKHGVFEQTANHHMNTGYGCILCAEEQDSKLKTKSLELFIQQAISIHGDKYDYSQVRYKHGSTRIEIICNLHGSFFQTPADHINSKAGCSKCAKIISKLEIDWLNYMSIPERYRHAKIKIGGKTLKPDAYDPTTNTVYEFYGDFWHGNPKLYAPDKINPASQKTFGELFSKTMEKEASLKASGYKLISIWENDWNLLATSPTPRNLLH